VIKKLRYLTRSKFNTIYSHNLLKQLQKEHKKLLKLINSLENSLIISRDVSLKKLEKFRHEFELHVILEHKKLYSKLHSKYEPCGITKIEEIKQELEKVIDLLDKLKEQINSRKTKEAKIILLSIQRYLQKRIDFEESILYKLYEHDYSCEELKLLLN